MKFYKITNKEEIHYGMQYHDGLNVDVLPFNPSGDCEKGGIYFAKEDILAFLYNGKWIREVTLPEDAKVYENPGSPKKWKADKVILGTRHEITFDVIKELHKEGANIHSDDEYLLFWASYNNKLNLVEYLVQFGADIHAKEDKAFRWAVYGGHLDVVKFLVENDADIHVWNDDAIKTSRQCGHMEIERYLKTFL